MKPNEAKVCIMIGSGQKNQIIIYRDGRKISDVTAGSVEVRKAALVDAINILTSFIPDSKIEENIGHADTEN